MLHVYNHYIIYCIYKYKQCTVIYIYIICNLYKSHYQIMVSATKKHAIRPFTILGARQGATLSSHAFLELPRLPWPYVVMTCVDRVRPKWFPYDFSSKSWWRKTSFYFKVGYDWFQEFDSNLVWEGLSLCRFLLVWWLWFVDWLTDCFIGCLRLVGFNIFSSSQRTWHQHILNTKKKSHDMPSNDTLW